MITIKQFLTQTNYKNNNKEAESILENIDYYYNNNFKKTIFQAYAKPSSTKVEIYYDILNGVLCL